MGQLQTQGGGQALTPGRGGSWGWATRPPPATRVAQPQATPNPPGPHLERTVEALKFGCFLLHHLLSGPRQRGRGRRARGGGPWAGGGRGRDPAGGADKGERECLRPARREPGPARLRWARSPRPGRGRARVAGPHSPGSGSGRGRSAAAAAAARDTQPGPRCADRAGNSAAAAATTADSSAWAAAAAERSRARRPAAAFIGQASPRPIRMPRPRPPRPHTHSGGGAAGPSGPSEAAHSGLEGCSRACAVRCAGHREKGLGGLLTVARRGAGAGGAA